MKKPLEPMTQPNSPAFDVEYRAKLYLGTGVAEDIGDSYTVGEVQKISQNAYKAGVGQYQAFLRERAAEGFDIVASVKRYMAKWEVGAQAGIPYREGVEDALDFCAAREAELRGLINLWENNCEKNRRRAEAAERLVELYRAALEDIAKAKSYDVNINGEPQFVILCAYRGRASEALAPAAPDVGEERSDGLGT
jgi:hypothetical protein